MNRVTGVPAWITPDGKLFLAEQDAVKHVEQTEVGKVMNRIRAIIIDHTDRGDGTDIELVIDDLIDMFDIKFKEPGYQPTNQRGNP